MSTDPENAANGALRARILELEEQPAATRKAKKLHNPLEVSLRQTLAYAESIVDTVREPMLVLDGKLRVQTASRAFYETFGVTKHDTGGLIVAEQPYQILGICELANVFEIFIAKYVS